MREVDVRPIRSFSSRVMSPSIVLVASGPRSGRGHGDGAFLADANLAGTFLRLVKMSTASISGRGGHDVTGTLVGVDVRPGRASLLRSSKGTQVGVTIGRAPVV